MFFSNVKTTDRRIKTIYDSTEGNESLTIFFNGTLNDLTDSIKIEFDLNANDNLHLSSQFIGILNGNVILNQGTKETSIALGNAQTIININPKLTHCLLIITAIGFSHCRINLAVV